MIRDGGPCGQRLGVRRRGRRRAASRGHLEKAAWGGASATSASAPGASTSAASAAAAARRAPDQRRGRAHPARVDLVARGRNLRHGRAAALLGMRGVLLLCALRVCAGLRRRARCAGGARARVASSSRASFSRSFGFFGGGSPGLTGPYKGDSPSSSVVVNTSCMPAPSSPCTLRQVLVDVVVGATRRGPRRSRRRGARSAAEARVRYARCAGALADFFDAAYDSRSGRSCAAGGPPASAKASRQFRTQAPTWS